MEVKRQGLSVLKGREKRISCYIDSLFYLIAVKSDHSYYTTYNFSVKCVLNHLQEKVKLKNNSFIWWGAERFIDLS